MATVILILAALCVLGTLAVMAAGVLNLGSDGEQAGTRSNRLMRARVLLQGGAVVFVLLYAAIQA